MKIAFTRVAAPALLMAGLAFSCSSSDTDTNNRDSSANPPGSELNDPAHGGNASGSSTDSTGTNHMNGTNSGSNGSTNLSGTPAEERMNTMTDMNGLRATLLADLEAVRARLNVGTMPKEQKVADTELAAELAQGLERVDRALAAMNASTDATWADIRASQKKEVEEVRTWMAGYKAKNDASARK